MASWKETLSKGRTWKDEEGANWPVDNTLRSGWQQLLLDKGLPPLVRKYQKLADPLLASLLEIVEEFYSQEQEEQNDEEQDGDEGSEGQTQSNGEGQQTEGVESEDDRKARAGKLLEQLAEKWGAAAGAMKAAEAAFGSGAGPAMVEGFSQDGSEWHETLRGQMGELQALAKVLRRSPELRELVRNLGRRSAVRGPLQKLPEES